MTMLRTGILQDCGIEITFPAEWAANPTSSSATSTSNSAASAPSAPSATSTSSSSSQSSSSPRPGGRSPSSISRGLASCSKKLLRRSRLFSEATASKSASVPSSCSMILPMIRSCSACTLSRKSLMTITPGRSAGAPVPTSSLSSTSLPSSGQAPEPAAARSATSHALRSAAASKTPLISPVISLTNAIMHCILSTTPDTVARRPSAISHTESSTWMVVLAHVRAFMNICTNSESSVRPSCVSTSMTNFSAISSRLTSCRNSLILSSNLAAAFMTCMSSPIDLMTALTCSLPGFSNSCRSFLRVSWAS
mmetsp:Transcript_92248/g.296578  ORF Transcript_92248/g.296578 Transcript_92248/m.296578 type:complete len:308 (+) Transcript_92248:242-1165(+)